MTSLRAFEASARHLSFTRAALELSLTPAAVSHQVKNLEDLLGTQLFVRNNNALCLGEGAAAYLRVVRHVLLELATATELAADQHDDRVLTVECLGTFAIKRLMPHLRDFHRQHPRVSLRLRTRQSGDSAAGHAFDVAVWHGDGAWPGVSATAIGAEEVFPVCSPQLLATGPPLRQPQDLRHHTVIRTYSLTLQDEWPLWLQAAGVAELESRLQISCDYQITSVHAALDHLGVALGRSSLVESDLRAGRLVAPFALRVRSPYCYYLVTPERSQRLRKVQLFKAWLLERLSSTPPAPAVNTRG